MGNLFVDSILYFGLQGFMVQCLQIKTTNPGIRKHVAYQLCYGHPV